jgi:large subunit ribosomal protein L29
MNMKTREIKELNNKEIQERIDVEKEHMVRLKLNHAISPLDNPLQIKEVRRTLARLATELRQRELINKN